MSLKEKGYAIYWAAAGITMPGATAAFVRERCRTLRIGEKIVVA